MDWVFIALMWSLLALGLVLLAWALLWDRPRGRRRCPKCWYGMEGVPEVEGGGWTCPECGRSIQKERRLLRTRRRWGLAALAMLLLVGSYASYSGPIVRDHGWWRLAPDVVLMAMLPKMDSYGRVYPGPNRFFEEVNGRRFGPSLAKRGEWSTGDLWNWERAFLARQSAALLQSTQDRDVYDLAIRMLAVSADDPVSLATDTARGDIVVAKAKHRYATASTYACVGVMKRWRVLEGRGTQENPVADLLFALAYERDGRSFSELRFGPAEDAKDWSRWEVETRDAEGQRALHYSSRSVRSARGNGMLLDHPGLATALETDKHPRSWLSWFSDQPTHYVEEVTLDGRRCHLVVTDRSLAGTRMHGWFDADTGLLVRMESVWHDGNGGSTTDYLPTVNETLAAGWWDFDAEDPDRSPLMQRFDEIKGLFIDTTPEARVPVPPG